MNTNWDNKYLLEQIELSVQGTSHADNVTDFKESGDGRGAWKALCSANTDSGSQYEDAQNAKSLLQTRKWSDKGSIPLQSHVILHRKKHAEIKMQAKGSKKVTIMTAYDCCYTFLISIIASEKKFVGYVALAQRELEDGISDRFEPMAVSLIRKDPVAAKITTTTKGNKFDISSTALEASGAGDLDLKYYPRDEYSTAIDTHGELFLKVMRRWRNFFIS